MCVISDKSEVNGYSGFSICCSAKLGYSEFEGTKEKNFIITIIRDIKVEISAGCKNNFIVAVNLLYQCSLHWSFAISIAMNVIHYTQ
jgi:hypothetical protein